MRKIFETRWKPIRNRREGLESVLDEEFAYFDDSLPNELLASKRCDLDVLFLPEKYGVVWVTQKDSVLNKLLQY